MMQIKSSGNPILETEQQEQIRQHVIDVIKSNGYTDEELANLEVAFPNNNQLLVKSKNGSAFSSRR